MTKLAPTYIDIHVLQTVPPSCVNRDDTGSPKTAVYGGVTRARVSSQAWKHAIREMMKELLTQNLIGVRTKHLVKLIAKEISILDNNINNPDEMAQEALKKSGVIKEDKKSKSKEELLMDALCFISQTQAQNLAKLAINDEKNAKKYKDAIKENPAVDIVLFGRMIANNQNLNYDAAAQVAHSISTHEVHNEYDYFTAMDDLSPDDSAGAAHLDTIEFNSSTLYRYATLNLKEVATHFDAEQTVQAACAFIQSFLLSMPTGKQNTFANRTAPDLAYITIRSDQPVNLVGAFEKPVRSKGEGYVTASEAALIGYAQKIYGEFISPPQQAFIIGGSEISAISGQRVSLTEFLEQMKMTVCTKLKAGEEA